MHRLMVSVLLCGCVLGPQEAAAFWRRSQVSMCADAVTDAERIRHRCWELDPYLDPGWPPLGLRAGVLAAPGQGRWQGHSAPPPPAIRKGVTQRLG